MEGQPDAQLSGEDVLLLLEALEAFLPSPEAGGEWAKLPVEEREHWQPYTALRRRLKNQAGMSFFDRPGRWLEDELRRERNGFGDKLFSRLAELLRDPRATRRRVREGFSAALRELREERQISAAPRSVVELAIGLRLVRPTGAGNPVGNHLREGVLTPGGATPNPPKCPLFSQRKFSLWSI
jgi:hypothetical protein